MNRMIQVQVFWIIVVLGIVVVPQRIQDCPGDRPQGCPYDAISPECEVDDKRRNLKAMGSGVYTVDNELYPYIVSLQTLKCGNHALGTGCYQHFCAGTMIAPNLILTTAHCFDDLTEQPSTTLTGQQYYTSRQPIYAAISPKCRHLQNEKYGRFQVNSIFIHPEYNRENFSNDIAVLEIFRENGQYYEGPVVDIVDEGTADDVTRALGLGYGQAYPQDMGKYIVYPLHGAELVPITEQQCLNSFDDYSGKYLNYTNMMCYWNKNADFCAGDAGGPLLLNQSTQIGLVSWAPAGGCETVEGPQLPSVYVRLSLFKKWIQQLVTDYSA